MDTSCALGRPGLRCLLDAEIQALVDIYNEKVGSKLKVPLTLDKQQVLDLLEKKTGCTDEECVVCRILEAVRGTVYESVVLRIKEAAFKIEGPEDLTALLDNFLIIRICRQLEVNYPGEKFGGVLTVDFMTQPITSIYGTPREVWNDYSSNNWNKFQMVFNIDHRMGVGQHWTSFLIDAKNGTMEYFDSYGAPPPDGILTGSRIYKGITDEKGRFISMLRNWMNDVREEFILHGLPLKFIYNTTCHQAPDDQSNCGPYAILFLALRSKDVSFQRITKEVITTEEIERIRNKLYRRSPDYVPTPPASS